jgi:transposase
MSLSGKRGALIQQPDATCRQSGRELGINAPLLSRWPRALAAAGVKGIPGQGKLRNAALLALRRALTRVKRERDFLTAAACFAPGSK